MSLSNGQFEEFCGIAEKILPRERGNSHRRLKLSKSLAHLICCITMSQLCGERAKSAWLQSQPLKCSGIDHRLLTESGTTAWIDWPKVRNGPSMLGAGNLAGGYAYVRSKTFPLRSLCFGDTLFPFSGFWTSAKTTMHSTFAFSRNHSISTWLSLPRIGTTSWATQKW